MTPDPNEKRRAYFREYRRKWREANREKYLALNKQVTVKKHATLKRIAELEAEVARLKRAAEIAKDFYSTADTRLSKSDLMAIGFTKEEADNEWETYLHKERLRQSLLGSLAKQRKTP